MPAIINNQYVFVLGNNSELSLAEIFSVLKKYCPQQQIVFASKEILIIDTETILPLNKLQDNLGGTIKIAKIIGETVKENIESAITKVVLEQAKSTQQKFYFGFSVFCQNPLPNLEALGLKIKRAIKQEGQSVKFVVSKEKNLSSVIVNREHLLKDGLDLIIVEIPNNYILAKTEAVQDYLDYSKKDFGRPWRDDLSGMLPPKLAKIMINLAEVDVNATIGDLFCGSGTVIQEALFLGYKNIIGSDISAKAIDDTKNNLNWLKTKYALDISGCKIFMADATALAGKIQANSLDAIISEPYLGEAKISKFKTQNLKELENLYLNSFKELHKILKPQGKIIFIIPIIDSKPMMILEQIERIGFKADKLSSDNRGSLIYSRPEQRVKREIFRFIKA